MGQQLFQLERLQTIADLARKIQETNHQLQVLLEEWNKNYPSLPLSVSGGTSPELPPLVPVSSIDDRIVHHLDNNPDRQFNANMLHEELSIPPSSLGTQLSKLYRQKRIHRRGRGFYSSLSSNVINELDLIQEKEVTEVTS